MAGQQHFPVALTPEKGPVRIVLEVGWGGGFVAGLDDMEDLSITKIQSPKRPCRSKSL